VRLKEALAAWEACLKVTQSAWPGEWNEGVRSSIAEVKAEIERRSAKGRR
jgi:hypothetical protein